MSSRSLEDLLSSVDEFDAIGPTSGTSLPARDLAQRVIQRRNRQRYIKQVVASTAALMVVLGSAVWMTRTVDNAVPAIAQPKDIAPHPVGSASKSELVELQPAEISQILQETKEDAELVRKKLAEHAQLARIEALQRELTALENYDARTPRNHATAAVSVASADRLLAIGMQSEAVATYRRIADWYPDTPGGNAARDRLLHVSMN